VRVLGFLDADLGMLGSWCSMDRMGLGEIDRRSAEPVKSELVAFSAE